MERVFLVMNKLKWLYPGIGVKRWIFLIVLGLFLLSSGLAVATNLHFGLFFERLITAISLEMVDSSPLFLKIITGVLTAIVGLIIIFWSLGKIEKKISDDLLSNNELVDILYENSLLGKGPQIVSLGGGTGLSNLLRGLKKYSNNLTALVTVADDGGSSGKLRQEMGILPPGDIRNCLIALADIEPLMQKLMKYRFKCEGNLKGHSFGNLFIAAMNQIVDGDFEEAVKASSKVLAIKGQVLPATNENIQLGAIYQDKTVRMGESLIPEKGRKIEKVFLKPATCKPTADALKAISDAEIITIGPGSLYTSILPNLLVNGIASSIKESQAVKIYVCNVMTQPGETDGYTVFDHVQALIDHVGSDIIDYVIVNDKDAPEQLSKKYRAEGAYQVENDLEKVKEAGFKVVSDNLLSGNGFLRHNSELTAARILEIFERG